MARSRPALTRWIWLWDFYRMTDYTTDAGTDARNYGDLEGLHEARELFADVMGVRPEEVFVGGNSSLQLMCNLISRWEHAFGFPESPCPGLRCPAPSSSARCPAMTALCITGVWLWAQSIVPMSPTGPDMDMIEAGG